TIGFAPDADFPIINAEKGIATLVFKQKREETDHQLLYFKSGNRTNMVPDYAEAHLTVGIDEIGEQYRTFLNVHDAIGYIKEDEDKTIVTLNGKSAHAMEPDDGVNAAVLLASFLNRIFTEGSSKDFAQFIADAFGNETRGHFLG